MKLVFAVAVQGLIAVAVASEASAENSYVWGSVGAGCVRGDTAEGKFHVQAGRVGFSTGETGTFQLYCPVRVMEPFVFDPNRLQLFYRDDGAVSGASASVTATLLRMSTLTGAITPVASVSSIDYEVLTSATVSHSFDFVTYYYYVRVDLTRSDPLYTPQFLGVVLEYSCSFCRQGATTRDMEDVK
jgi:hypothetical protein